MKKTCRTCRNCKKLKKCGKGNKHIYQYWWFTDFEEREKVLNLDAKNDCNDYLSNAPTVKCPEYYDDVSIGNNFYKCYEENPLDFWTCGLGQKVCLMNKTPGRVTKEALAERMEEEADSPVGELKRLCKLEAQVEKLEEK